MGNLAFFALSNKSSRLFIGTCDINSGDFKALINSSTVISPNPSGSNCY